MIYRNYLYLLDRKGNIVKRPTFFLSSTIYDFADLRSAIKYFLEQQGCAVLASEYNDFRKPLDKHSYDACLEAIRQADYFILLIGARVGGWYDKSNRISITQREYREAYNLCQSGSIKIITFVRQDIWNLRSDRAELQKHLESLTLEETEKNEIANHPSKRATDPEFISNFITEVGRNQDTKNALSGNGTFPAGNWIHVFSSFRDVADVLSTEIFNDLPIEEAVSRRLLLGEIKEILRKSLPKLMPNKVYSPTRVIRKLYAEHEISKSMMDGGIITINTRRWDMLSSFSIHLLGLSLNPMILPQVLSTSVFLQFNTDLEAFEEQPIYAALHLLHEEIRLLSKGNTSETISIVFEHTPRRRYPNQTEVNLDSMKFLALLHLLQRWSNIIELSRAVIRFLEGHEFRLPVLFDRSPIIEMNKELEAETVTEEELHDFVYE
jgi:hypothetical protein